EIEIRPAIAVEVGHSDGGTDGCDVRLDVGDLWIEARTMVDEVNSRRGRRIVQHEAGMHWVRRGADRPMIQPHREQDRDEEWHGDDGSASEGRGTAHAGCGTRVGGGARAWRQLTRLAASGGFRTPEGSDGA